MASLRKSDDLMPQTLQEMLLALLVFSDSAGGSVSGILHEHHFDGVYRDVAAAALTYRKKYGEPPGRAHVEDAVLVRSSRGGPERAQRILRQLEARAGEVNPDYALARAREHVRRVSLRTALVEAGHRFDGPTEGAVDEMEAILYRALRARADEGDPGTFLSDPKALGFLDRHDEGVGYSLGIEVLDHIGVRMLPGKLILYLAPKSSGKSWFCVHCGRQALRQGARVAHVSLEMDEDDVSQRYHQTYTALAPTWDKYPLTDLEVDSLGKVVGWDTSPSSPRMSIKNPGVKIREWLRREIKKRAGSDFSRLVVKRYSSGTLTIDKLRGYLDYLEASRGFVPDVLIVDYPDLMKFSPRDYRLELGRAYVELRGLGGDRGMCVVAPTQTNRAGLGASTTIASMVSEDKTKLDTADVVISYSRTKMEKERGLARICLEYARGAPDGYVLVLSQSYATGQYMIKSALHSSAYQDAMRGLREDPGGEDSAGDDRRPSSRSTARRSNTRRARRRDED